MNIHGVAGSYIRINYLIVLLLCFDVWHHYFCPAPNRALLHKVMWPFDANQNISTILWFKPIFFFFF